jgi:hypothetical protein
VSDPPAGAHEARSAWAILWRSGAFLVVWGILLAPLIVPLSSNLAEWEKVAPIKARLYADAAGAVTMLTATWLLTRFVDRRPFRSIGFAPHRFGRDALAGIAFGALWLAVSVGAAWGAGWVRLQSIAGISVGVLLGAALATFLNVLTQQLLLCGYVFQTIRRRAGFGLAIGLTVSGSGRFGYGWSPLAVSGPDLWVGGRFGLEGGLVVTITTAAGILAMALAGRHLARRHGQRSLGLAGSGPGGAPWAGGPRQAVEP